MFLLNKKLVVLALIGVTVGAFSGMAFSPKPSEAAVSDWQKGANMVPASNTDYASASFDQSLRNLAATGANYVTLEIPFYQSNIYSTDLQDGWNTPTDQSLASGIQFAHSIGLHVALKFAVFPYDGQWSAYINPSDRDTWFANYNNIVSHFTQIAQQNGVEELMIGTELIDMSTDTSNSTNAGHWYSLIGSIRSQFSGKLTYDANFGGPGFTDEKNHISFWPALDYIGISAYYNLNGDGSVASLMSSWDSYNKNDIQPLQEKWGKPILFTEAGYRSIHDSYTHPWNWSESGSPDVNQQANDYQALFQYWNQYPYMAGVQLWNWTSNPNAGGTNDTNYTPQNKPAQDVMKQWFTSSSGGDDGGGTTPPPPVSPAVFSATASAAPASPTVGQDATFSVSVSNTGGAASGANVDVEIYNSGGGRVFQQIFAGQNIASNSTANFSSSWTAVSADSYTLKVGVFSGDWSQTYYWGNKVLVFSVADANTSGDGGGSNGGSSSNPSNAAINVWWPTDGSSISGVQPFKAMLTNWSVDDYSMFWTVDNGQWNSMASNDTDYPHKEAFVDVTPWTWNGSGPYMITFIASANGQTVAQTSVNIND